MQLPSVLFLRYSGIIQQVQSTEMFVLFQSFIFQLKSHPLKPDYEQCTTIGFFDSASMVNGFLNSFSEKANKLIPGVALLHLCIHNDLALTSPGDDWKLLDHHCLDIQKILFVQEDGRK